MNGYAPDRWQNHNQEQEEMQEIAFLKRHNLYKEHDYLDEEDCNIFTNDKTKKGLTQNKTIPTLSKDLLNDTKAFFSNRNEKEREQRLQSNPETATLSPRQFKNGR